MEMTEKVLTQRPAAYEIVAPVGGTTSAVDYILDNVGVNSGDAGNADAARFRPVATRMVEQAVKVGGFQGKTFVDRLSLGAAMEFLENVHGMSDADRSMAAVGTEKDVVRLPDLKLQEGAVGGLLRIAGVAKADYQIFKPVAQVMVVEAWSTSPSDGKELLQRIARVKAGKG